MSATPPQSSAAAAPSFQHAAERSPLSIRALTVAELSAGEYERVISTCFSIYESRCTTLDRVGFARRYFAKAHRLALFLDELGAAVGFVAISRTYLAMEGRGCMVTTAPVMFRPGYRGGARAVRFGLLDILRFKLRHPLTTCAYLTQAATEAAYSVLARHALVYPRPDVAVPEVITRRVEAAIAGFDIPVDPDDRWLAPTTAQPRSPHKLGTSQRLRRDPHAAWFQARVTTRDRALLVWVPLDLGNVLAGLWRSLTRG